MKTFFFSLILFFGITMSENNPTQPPIKLTVELPDTVRVGERSIPIILKVKNLSSKALLIRNPIYWGNAFPIVKRGTDVVAHDVRINPALNNLHSLVEIKKNEMLKFVFTHPLDRIYDLNSLSPGEYNIHFVFYYEPKKRPKRTTFLRAMFRRKPSYFKEEKFVRSNVFTFYVQSGLFPERPYGCKLK